MHADKTAPVLLVRLRLAFALNVHLCTAATVNVEVSMAQPPSPAVAKCQQPAITCDNSRMELCSRSSNDPLSWLRRSSCCLAVAAAAAAGASRQPTATATAPAAAACWRCCVWVVQLHPHRSQVQVSGSCKGQAAHGMSPHVLHCCSCQRCSTAIISHNHVTGMHSCCMSYSAMSQLSLLVVAVPAKLDHVTHLALRFRMAAPVLTCA
jgi:hypothetical protein